MNYNREEHIVQLMNEHNCTREQAKALTFYKAYGIGAKRLQEYLSSPPKGKHVHQVYCEVTNNHKNLKHDIHHDYNTNISRRIAKRYRVKNRG